jgi:hypothetical protein
MQDWFCIFIHQASFQYRCTIMTCDNRNLLGPQKNRKTLWKTSIFIDEFGNVDEESGPITQSKLITRTFAALKWEKVRVSLLGVILLYWKISYLLHDGKPTHPRGKMIYKSQHIITWHTTCIIIYSTSILKDWPIVSSYWVILLRLP